MFFYNDIKLSKVNMIKEKQWDALDNIFIFKFVNLLAISH